MNITKMAIDDYEDVISLWQSVTGIGLHDDSDSKEAIARYLQRNLGLSFVARDNGKLLGAVLCGYDSRRGYLHHLAVAEAYREKGIGRALLKRVLAGLQLFGISKCHVFIFSDNLAAQEFWEKIGWSEQQGLKVMSRNIDCRNKEG